MKLDALILDFGGVISKTLFETHAQTERVLGLPSGSLQWRGPFDPDSDPLWQSMQQDEISERQYWQTRSCEMGKLVGEEWRSVAEMVHRVRGDDPAHCIRESATLTVRRVRQLGKKLAILSNELDLFYGRDLRRKLSLLDQFDLICDATYTQILKPDPRAYSTCIEQLQVAPDRCLFVDDQMRNIEGAKAVGCQVLHFDVRCADDCYVEIRERMAA